MKRTDINNKETSTRKITRRFLLPGRFFASPKTKLVNSVRLPGFYIVKIREMRIS